MKRFLLLAASLGAVTALAQAQTQLTIYGIADLGIVSEHGGPAGSVLKLTSGIANGSRLGFKGAEDLGGGMSALFTLESGILADTGAMGQGGLLFGRQAFVGLSGPLGALKLGRQYTFIDSTMGVVDPFYLGFAGRMSNVFAAGYVSRFDNGVMFNSPNMNGFTADLAYGFGEVAGSISAKRYYGAAAGYSQGPLFVRLAHQDSNTLSTTLVAGSARNTVLGGTYNFGAVRGHAAYGVSKTTSGITTVDSADAMIGATVPFGPHALLASYVRRNDRLIAANDARQIAVGYTHALSKRTTLYTAYARIHNSNTGRYVVGNATEAGSGDKAFNLGMRHTF
jgi:predicted porin